MTLTLYGIANCDSVKQARLWLAAEEQPYQFHDFKKQGLERATIEQWLSQLPWELLLNRKGTTWRGLSEARKAAILDAASATELMLEFHSVIKRPVLQQGARYQVGFAAAQYQQFFSLEPSSL